MYTFSEKYNRFTFTNTKKMYFEKQENNYKRFIKVSCFTQLMFLLKMLTFTYFVAV